MLGNSGCPNLMPGEEAALIALQASWQKYALDQQALFEKQKAKRTLEDQGVWHKGLDKLASVLRDHQAVSLQHYQKKEQRLQEEINELNQALWNERSKHSGRIEKLNIRGALERIAEKVEKQKEIPSKKGKQAILAAIAKSEQFTKILNEEAPARGLKPKEVRSRAISLYSQLSGYAHGFDEPIVVKAWNHPPDERAALIVLLKLQDKWPDPLSWREEKE